MKLNGYIGSIQDAPGYLFRDGKTDYKILIPHNACDAECFAAKELTEIFAKSGVSIQTVSDKNLNVDSQARYIALGDSIYFRSLGISMHSSEYKFDGFLIESIGNTYVIKGVNDTGTCFGVYGFAEYAMGYVYYAPDEWKVSTEAQNREFHIKEIPSFYSRFAYSYYTKHFMDHSFRLRINGEFCIREARHGNATPWSTLHDMSYAIQILPHEIYRAEHPEWYYLTPEHENAPFPKSAPQICFSKGLQSVNEGGFFELFMDRLIHEYIIPEKDKTYFMLGISDNQDYCQCEACQKAVAKYGKSGLSMQFVNKVAEAVEAWRVENAPEREIWMITFAYLSTFDPPIIFKDGQYFPVDESVVARDNVIVRIAPIAANYMYDLLDEEHNPESRRSLLGWSAVCKHLSVWDYRQDFGCEPFLFPTTVSAQANHDIYCKLGMTDVFNQAQGHCPGSPFILMDDFARARMHWNAKEEYAQLTEEFREAYYKEAAPYVTEYLHAMEAYYPILISRGWNALWKNRIGVRKYLHTVEDMYRFRDILDRALAAAKSISDPDISAKVYARVNELTLFYKLILVICFPLDIPREYALALIADLRELSKAVGLTYCQRQFTTEEHLNDSENLILGKYPESQRKLPLRTP